MHISKNILLLIVSFSLALTMNAVAQTPAPTQDMLKVVNGTSGEEMKQYKDTPTHPAIKLTPDKSEIIRLDQPAATVIIGNQTHLAVLPSSTQGLILVGRAPGATHFIALNENNEIIMQRHVIIASPKKDYVRIRKTCAATDDESCQTTQVFYCPDACHETIINRPQEETENIAPNRESEQASNDAPNESEIDQ